MIVLNDRQMEEGDAQQGGEDAPAQNRDANGNRNAGGRPNRHRRMIVSDESDNDDDVGLIFQSLNSSSLKGTIQAF